jgi:hypothetical protein
MLPVSAWPPGPPGASLSPFGQPRQVKVCGNGYVIPKGAWIVATGSNRVVMFYPPVVNSNPARTLGTGMLPGSIPTPPPQQCGCPPKPSWEWPKYNDQVEWYRAHGRNAPRPGTRPPNWFGWKFVPAPSSTLVPSGASGLVIADGQNVVITGSGCATITQAYSV